jgi:hypothetical protein
MDRTITYLHNVVNEEGRHAKYVQFENEDKYYLIVRDPDGNITVSDTVSNIWYKVKDSTEPGVASLKIALKAQTASTMEFTGATVGKLASSVCNLAIGDFLYKLMKGKDDVRTITKDLVKDTSQYLALKVMIKSCPHLALAMATIIGIRTLNSVVQNEFIGREQKIERILNIFGKTGFRLGAAFGGALVGQALLPIPILGAFLGGVAGTIAS